MKYYTVFFENDVRGDGVDTAGPFVTYLSDEEAELLKSNTIFPYVSCTEHMGYYLEDHSNYTTAALFNELYNVRPWYDVEKNGPVVIHGNISAWMSTDM